MKSIYRVLLVLFFLLIYVITCAQAQIHLSPEEKAFLETHPLILVANEMDWPPFDFVENGVAKGYSIDLLNLIAKKTGINFKYVNGYSWDTLLEMGKQRELDVFPALWRTEEREQYFNFSVAYIDTPYILVIHEDQHQINDIDNLKGKTLTGIKGFASTELVNEHYPDIHVVKVDSAAEGLRQVSYGKADAYLGSMAETNFAIKNHLVPNLKIAGETNLGGRVKSPLLYIGVRKDWPIISRIIQRGMAAISQEEKQILQAKWLEFERKPQTMVLDKAEKRFLQDHSVLRVAFAEDWPPVEYVSKNGDMKGIAADYLKRISELLGVKVQPVSLLTRKEMLTAVRNGKIDFLSAVTPTIRQREWMNFTDSYLSFPIVVVTREDVPYIGDLEFLEGKSIAVVEGYASHEFMTSNHPNLNLLVTPGVKEGLLAVANKEAFAFVGSLATVSHVTGREGLTGLKVSGETPYNVDISMATRGKDTILMNLLQKALSAISQEERNAMYSKWSRMTFEYRVNYSILWKVGAGFFILITLILYWNSRLRSMANELKLARDAAESANKAKSAFLANMSHELRTPLNSILGFSQIMANEETLSKDQKDNLRTINSSGEHLLGLLNDILDIAKVEAGRIVLRESVFDLHQMMTDIRDMLKALANDKGLHLNVDIYPGTPRYVQADNERLRQVLVNLIVNSVKYTSVGSIAVSVRGEPLDKSTSEIQLEFIVKDTGKGIDPDFRDKVFEPFIQAHSGSKSPDGTGLGLSICRTLVQMMKGDIRLESDVGKGTTFFVNIMVNSGVVTDVPDGKLPKLSAPYVTGLAPGHPEFKVLVVDDIDTNRKLLMSLLQKAGFLVRGVNCAQKAFETMKQWEPQLIWMDIRMPEIDGMEATQQIRKSGYSDVKIIGISASVFEDDKAACLAAGCDDFITKPINNSIIFEKMMHHLGVSYIYSNDGNSDSQTSTSVYEPELIFEAITCLPNGLPASLKEAVFSFDYEKTMEVAGQIRQYDKSLAETLSKWAAGYQFGPLQNLFNKSGDKDD